MSLRTVLIALTAAALLGGCATTPSPFEPPLKKPPTAAQRASTDKAVELAIGKAIYTDERLRHKVHININSLNGIVLLTGEAPSASYRSQAVEHARRVKNVKRIHNEILVRVPSSLASRTRDTIIAGRTRLDLQADERLKGLDIRVVVENQSIYLMGRASRAEAEIATNIARCIKGVNEVVTLFDYQN
ncbi:MAG TPA: BON domain-containing protein [Candidatus Tenderia sp.]|nr:BON domain-containing protein [Candidatus Tenderia sp.]